MPMAFKNAKDIKRNGYKFLGNQLVEGYSLFTGTDEANAKSLRDAFFTSNPNLLAALDADPQTMVTIAWGSPLTTQLNSRVSGVWVNTFESTSSGVTPSSTAPTEIIFGSEAPNDSSWSPPSGYLYPLLSPAKISCIAIGSGDLTDSDASKFTSATYNPSALTLDATLTGQWSGGVSGMVTDVGAIDMTADGTNISFSEL